MEKNFDEKVLQDAVIKTLQYFDIFKHPVTLEEIHKFLGIDIQLVSLYKSITYMVDSGQVFSHSGYYMLQNNAALATKRMQGQIRAEKILPRAYKSANFIAKFPFVRCVCISGSLSKGYANEKSDIDLFIITKKKRLWVSRSILHLFKKLTFIWGGQHSYCMNYFIDESALGLEEQNIFTATELATLLPAYNTATYREFIGANKSWMVKIYPNIQWDQGQLLNSASDPLTKIITEGILNLMLASKMNIALMRLTDTWWRYKWNRKGYPMDEYELAMKTKWYVSKHHPLNYQKRVLAKMQERSQHNKFTTAVS